MFEISWAFTEAAENRCQIRDHRSLGFYDLANQMHILEAEMQQCHIVGLAHDLAPWIHKLYLNPLLSAQDISLVREVVLVYPAVQRHQKGSSQG
jgi:hypothetical protein